MAMLSGLDRNCEAATRRDFLQLGALAGLGIGLPQMLQAKQAALRDGKPASDVNCILVWTHGGTSHHDTVDPKPNAPQAVRGPYSLISTAVPGVQFTEVAPHLAASLDRFGLLRSWNPQNGSHGSADAIVMSGHTWNPALPYPTFGSVVSYYRGFKSVMPPFIQLGAYLERGFGGGTSGFLPQEHMPFDLLEDPNNPNFAVRDITPPNKMGFDRVARRKNVLERIDALQKRADKQPAAYDVLDEHYKAAINMITSADTRRAFDIEKEDPRLRDKYGRNFFGQRCLLARRLLQAGVRFVTVTDPSWDTHADNFNSLKNSLMPRIDQGLPALVADLEQQGMLDNTLVLWVTDFGRTPKINSASGRDHWASAGFMMAAGAGIPGGSVIGATDDEGGAPIKDEYLSADVGATVYHKLGIPADLMARTADGRPILLNEGRLIKQWC